jgi:hypothetical protein
MAIELSKEDCVQAIASVERHFWPILSKKLAIFQQVLCLASSSKTSALAFTTAP